jgi:hypothetical protein
MGLPRANEVFAPEIENHLAGAYRTNDFGVDVCHRVGGNLERKQPAPWMPMIIAKFLKVIGDLTVNVGQTHFFS